ncbi:MAG: WecB/TagA/CpsF family glycosyltransferase [Desulfobacteraceae bacterium]|jgi:N-acetylglucosaminyldiphosphoundecaprenol N-acetyl-beta-D-mannosaminyltransferase|nr:WecB/TagA/CpsF family glycosyltransferase [Desulfobacteraceae bacterium]
MTQDSSAALFGLTIRNVNLSEASVDLVKAAREGVRRQVFFVNAHCVNVAARDQDYLDTLRAANFLYADGSGMRLAARLAGQPLRDNVNGTDLFPMLCREAAASGVGIALLGARPGIAERCADKMRHRFPGLKVVWVHHGYLNAAEGAALISSLNESGAGLLLVAMGVPVQEKWIARHAGALRIPVLLGVGALFDFYSGEVSRAPAFMRKLGLEWGYRLLVEPRRMFARYVLGNPVFVGRALLRRMRGRETLRHAALIGD